MHTMQMPNYLARLVIEEIRDAIALIPVPIEEVQLVIETLETFVSWPKQLVKAISTKDQVFFFFNRITLTKLIQTSYLTLLLSSTRP